MKSNPHVKFLPELIAFAFVFSVLFSCSSNSEQQKKSDVENEGKDTTTYNLKDYYFPLSEKMDTLFYKYRVIKKDKDGVKESFEYLVMTRGADGKYFNKITNENNVLTDSSIFRIQNDGVYYEQFNFFLIDGSYVKADVSPSRIFKWDRHKNDCNSNLFAFSYVFEEEFIQADWKFRNDFKGIERIENPVSEESECAHFKIYSEMKLKKPEKGDSVIFFIEGDLYDLKGVGYYKSFQKGIYGTEEKILVEIIKK